MATCCSPDDDFGADPANVKWNVVRGDTAILQVQFLETDEKTYYDTTDWEFVATVYDRNSNDFEELEVVVYEGYVDIVAAPDITENWGTGISAKVAELNFDLQVTTADDSVWTPVIGTIHVLGDITGGTL